MKRPNCMFNSGADAKEPGESVETAKLGDILGRILVSQTTPTQKSVPAKIPDINGCDC
jgi:hypothetical protein